jgi:hypothetical protein
MRNAFRSPAVMALLGGSAAVFSASDWALPAGEPKLKSDERIEVVTAQCLTCHSADYISTQPPLKRPAWQAIVVKMREKYGAPLPADQTDLVVDYLVQNYGVN